MENHQAEAEQAHRRGSFDGDGTDDGDQGTGPHLASDSQGQPKPVSSHVTLKERIFGKSEEDLQAEIDELKGKITQKGGVVPAPERTDIDPGSILEMIEVRGNEYRLIYEPNFTAVVDGGPHSGKTFTYADRPYQIWLNKQMIYMGPTEEHARRIFARQTRRAYRL